MKINWLYVVLLVVIVYFIFFLKSNKKEGFETNQRVILKTRTDKYVKVCDDKQACLVDDKDKADQFSVMKFSEDLIALSKGGYYIASCFGDSCKDDLIKVNSFNPYAPNAKMALEKIDDHYYVKFYDEKYMSVDDKNNIIKQSDKTKALQIQFL